MVQILLLSVACAALSSLSVAEDRSLPVLAREAEPQLDLRQLSSVSTKVPLKEDFPSLHHKARRRLRSQNLNAIDLPQLGRAEELEARADEQERHLRQVKDGLVSIIFGALFFILAVSMQWFNEERSAKIDVLLARGLEECQSIDATLLNTSNRGRLVHAQGKAKGATPLVDGQFQDARVINCLKLQSTVEVFQWVPTTSGIVKEQRGMTRFQTEWTTSHHDSSRFRQPAPKNPRLPGGLSLGTITTICDNVELGCFNLSGDMLSEFRTYEPAMRRLPPVVSACGVTFHANLKDGFYYGRPGYQGVRPAKEELFLDHQEGDLRVRFMCVPDSDATVVGVQCHRDGIETFVPYRTISCGPCLTDMQVSDKLVEEGMKSSRDIRRAGESCFSGGVITCCCCPCNTVACFAQQEVVTEEILYISDSLDPPEKPFRKAVQRNPCRVWNWRFVSWALMYLSISMMTKPLELSPESLPLFKIIGSFCTLALTCMITFAIWALIVAVAYMCYRPSMGVKSFILASLIMATPFVVDKFASGHLKNL
eukprot:TRINITY_DN81253_c0_g1_i1.p1 TRINITY_DN81253_c0_g1~~TRINITY_DN81253_c0_g1_i1.p1  ORF type:complete len:538 (+),score=85.13 TRINITY_DN81253_c0_g1_i1:58-1671(+)